MLSAHERFSTTAVGCGFELTGATPAMSDLGPLRLGTEVTGIARAEDRIDHVVGRARRAFNLS
jgi:hypothetical protein